MNKLTEKNKKKKDALNRKNTRIRVRNYRQKKRDEGYINISFFVSPANKKILDRYISFKKHQCLKYSYDYIFNELISTILKSRNKSLYFQGCRY